MSLRFIYGRAGSGKSTYCLNDIKKKIDKQDDNKLILLVPEQFSFQSEKNLIHAIGERGILKAEVLSFRRMAFKVFNEVGGINRKHINDSGKSMLIYKIMEEWKHEFKAFSKAAQKQGFVSTISQLITEFKRYNVTPEILKISGENIENENLKDKIDDVALIFNEFESRLHKKYIDAEDDLTILANKIDKSKMFNKAEVWIDEFSSFTPQEYVVLEKILKKAKRVNITLSTDCLNGKTVVDNTEVFSPTKNTEAKLMEIVQKNNVKYDKPVELKCDPPYRFKYSSQISHLEKYLFSYPYRTFNSKGNDICIFKALNRYTEIENTARNILKLVRDSGFRFNDIAVITGDLDGYENLVRAVFSEYNIPYFIDKKAKISNNPIIVLIQSSIEILAKGWSYESVFRYLKTELTDVSREEIDIVENYVLSNGIRGKKWSVENKWDYRLKYAFADEEISEEEKQLLEEINSIKNKIVTPLNEFHNNIRGKKTGREMCTALYDFLEHIRVIDKVENWVNDFKYKGKLDLANEYSQIWNIVIDVMDQTVEVIGDEKLNADSFFNILKTGFEEYEIGLIPPAIDQVLVSSIERLRSHQVTALYVIGVNDGIFPKGTDSEGILNDMDRENLRETGIELAKDTKSKAFEEQFLVYTTLTTMNKYLRLSYPISDNEGKTMRPSIVISRIKKIFPNICEESNIIKKGTEEESLDMVSGENATFNELITQFRGSEEGFNLDTIWIDVYRWYKDQKKWHKKLEDILEGFSYNNEAEVIDTKKIRKLYGNNMSISVSRLEKYVKCPFAYFIQHGLKAKERKIYKLSSPDVGSFMHEVLDRFSKSINEKNMTWKDVDREFCNLSVSTIVDEKISNMPGSILNSSPRYDHMTDGIKKILKRAVWIITEHIKRGGFEPSGYELSFGFNGDFPPIEVELHSGEKVNLIGKVDRVDKLSEEADTYIRIIDYKSGNKDFKLSDVYYGLQIQLLVYLDAVITEIEEKFNEKGIPAGVLYFKLDDPIIKSKKDMSDEEIEKAILKSLKMKGLLLADTDILRSMDCNIEGNSEIIPARINAKDGSIGKSSSVATLEQFKLLRDYVRGTIIELCEEMLEGDIGIKPYKNKDYTPCKYCEYDSICQFDPKVEGNRYRIINEKTDVEVWKIIKEKVGKDE